jgi:tetratricopeptide (TPR) repeat protein
MRTARLLAFLVALSIGAGPAHADPARTVLERANDLYSRGRFEEALAVYREGILQYPSVPELHYGAGNALYRLKRFAEAAKEYDESARGGTSPESRYNKGNTEVRQNQLEGSLESYKQALREHPEDNDAKYNYELIRGRLQDQKNNQNQQNKGGGGKPQPNQPDPQKGGNKKQQGGAGDSQQKQGRAQKDPQELNKDQAEQILKALASDEQHVQGDRLKARVTNRRPEKDW